MINAEGMPNNQDDFLMLSEEEQYTLKHQVGSFERPASRIMRDIAPSVANGDFGLVLGEGSSARLATLLIGDVVNNIAPEPVAQRFISQTRVSAAEMRKFPEHKNEYTQAEKDVLTSEYLETLRPIVNGKKVLLVTEFIEYGDHISRAVKALEGAGLDFEVATFWIKKYKYPSGVDLTPDELIEIKQKLGNRFHIGEEVFEPTTSYKQDFNGVTKVPESIFSGPTDRIDTQVRDEIRFARKLLPPIVGRITQGLKQ